MSSSSSNDSASELIINHLTSNSTFQLYKELKCLEAEQSDTESSRHPEQRHKRLWKDYFDEHSVFPPQTFRRRFRMRRELLVQIVNVVFPLYKNALLPYANWCMAQLVSSLMNTNELVNQLQSNVYEIFHYLRKPNANDIQNLVQQHSKRHRFPGMLRSIDCMHWPWKIFPIAWQDLWIWHAYSGVAGCNNDINVLNQSPLFKDVLQGYALKCNFTVNGRTYTKGYYLADGIYLEWATMVKSFPHTANPKRIKFKEMKVAARKDVERAFGVLQSRWAIVRGPARSQHLKNIKDMTYT
uniref:DDE Tnp4 domain-containing protein n=1 Tax=Lactuca sativa TaxID=4236 RepID=A0A9R1X9S3_LACSA|nr:hypothetical protein LSAT_V11C500274300 [Lactuca sativa]